MLLWVTLSLMADLAVTYMTDVTAEIPKINKKPLSNKKITLITGTNCAIMTIEQVNNGSEQRQ